eukprot:scaffold177755_cov36-Prasinocladus_malaysianus.AAC.1
MAGKATRVTGMMLPVLSMYLCHGIRPNDYNDISMAAVAIASNLVHFDTSATFPVSSALDAVHGCFIVEKRQPYFELALSVPGLNPWYSPQH